MEYNKPQEKNFKEQLLKKIETDNRKAYSKAHFTLRMILLIVLAVLILLVSICLFSYICFNVRMGGHQSLLGFNPTGISLFFQFFPWTLFIIDAILVGVLVSLLRKFRFGYRVPVLYLLLILFVATSITGYAVYRTGFDEMVLKQANQNYLPLSGNY